LGGDEVHGEEAQKTLSGLSGDEGKKVQYPYLVLESTVFLFACECFRRNSLVVSILALSHARVIIGID